MYNLTVDEAHTFFVGDGQWLVHNTDICSIQRKYLEENGIPDLLTTAKMFGDNEATNMVVKGGYFDRGMHIPSVVHIAGETAKELGMSPEAIALIRKGAFYHDIGKNVEGIVDVSNFEGKLLGSSRALMEQHVFAGAWLLQGYGMEQAVVDMALLHHPGYSNLPVAVADIPYNVKILTAADMFSAMREPRLYRGYQGMPWDDIDVQLKKAMRNNHFSVEIYEALKEAMGMP